MLLMPMTKQIIVQRSEILDVVDGEILVDGRVGFSGAFNASELNERRFIFSLENTVLVCLELEVSQDLEKCP